MKTTHVALGSGPRMAELACPGQADYRAHREHQVRVFYRMLRRLFPPPAASTARLKVKSDIGPEVRVVCDPHDDVAHEYICRLQAEVPSDWDDEARAELAWYERHLGYLRRLRSGSLQKCEIPKEFMGFEPCPTFVQRFVERRIHGREACHA